MKYLARFVIETTTRKGISTIHINPASERAVHILSNLAHLNKVVRRLKILLKFS